MAHKGRYKPENPEKYRGDVTNIIWRSSWELKMFKRLDRDPNVVSWSSEEVVITYNDMASGRMRRYFPDVAYKRRDGKKFLVEIKPKKETLPPTRQGKSEKRFMTECLVYAKNISKWESARRWCERYGYEFLIITEKELGV